MITHGTAKKQLWNNSSAGGGGEVCALRLILQLVKRILNTKRLLYFIVSVLDITKTSYQFKVLISVLNQEDYVDGVSELNTL
jgi:hypothetical protein